ncbi:DUF6583 family protein [Virgibacillus ihumii]|uniref:DUF6583 family protein n=1 Tax=Virgibacillus ihumii TaxID=2686091 RepID=UPI00157CF125|nr:DUF6583 family protein [Virgibacillus ihumii]
MDETVNNGNKKQGLPKKVIAILVVALVIIGGSVAAYALLAGSAKAQYFLAEKNTIEFIGEQLEERYQPEFDWAKQASENPTETTLELSAEYNGPPAMGMPVNPQILNNATIDLTTQLDQQETELSTDVQVNFGGLTINDMSIYMNADDLMLQLPFLQETLKITDKGLSKLLKESDPTINGELDFKAFFKSMNGALSEEDRKYIKEEYLTFIYEQLPKDAFQSSEETVNVQDKSIDTKKITMNLSEKQVKDIITSVLEKMQKDDKLKGMIKDQIKIQQFGTLSAGAVANPVQNAMENFDKSLEEAMKGVKDFQIPEGLTSEIWINDDLIVKRNMEISMAPQDTEPATFSLNGTQLLSDSTQKVNYKMSVVNPAINEESSFNITANLSNKDNKLEDSISLSGGDTTITYNGSSTLEDNTREFERTLAVEGAGTFIWTGEASYNNDRMSSENTLTMEAPDLQQDMISLQIDKEAKTIKKVKQPDDSNVKDIGKMSAMEIQQYIQQEVRPQFQQWFMQIMGVPGGTQGF